jgi:TonB family protein
MKQLFSGVAFAALFILLPFLGKAQQFTNAEHSIQPAEFKNAHFPDLSNYLAQHLYFPEGSRRNGIEGTLKAALVIGKNGEVESVTILNGINKEIDKTVKDVLSNMPSWRPKIRKGFAVKETLILPIRFDVI